MNSMTSNGFWDLVELTNGEKTIGVNGSIKQRNTHWATLRDIKQNL